MLDTHYVVFVTKIMSSNIILPILSFCDTNVPDFASIERERERERERQQMQVTCHCANRVMFAGQNTNLLKTKHEEINA